MAEPHYEAWDDYRGAIEALYEVPLQSLIATTEPTLPPAPQPDQVDRLLDHSQRLADALATKLDTEDADQRNLAQMQLAAGAAVDIGLGNDLLRVSDEGGEVSSEGSASFVLPEAEPVLSATHPDEAIAGQAGTPGSADADALKAAVEKAIDAIHDDATTGAQSSFAGLVGIGGATLAEAANAVLSQALEKLGGQVSWLVHKAIALVLKAVDKLLSLLGKDRQDQLRRKVAEWVQGLEEGDLAGAVLDRVYETGRLKKALADCIDQGASNLAGARSEQAQKELAALTARLHKQMGQLGWVVKGLQWVGTVVVGLQPAGPLLLAGAYLGALSFSVVSGGDYLDWYRVEVDSWLDRVDGVRHVVAAAVPECAG